MFLTLISKATKQSLWCREILLSVYTWKTEIVEILVCMYDRNQIKTSIHGLRLKINQATEESSSCPWKRKGYTFKRRHVNK